MLVLMMACVQLSGLVDSSQIPSDSYPACTDSYPAHMYYFSDQMATYEDAQTDCAAQGLDLVTINDASENVCLYTMAMQRLEQDWWWIGLNDLENEGHFFWDEGSSTYANWASDQPSEEYADTLDCAAFGLSGEQWHTRDCKRAARFICE